MEASRRIELLYTDLQSNRFFNEINAQALEKYQDKAGTPGEPDTRANSIPANENPGALAGATGAKIEYEAANFDHDDTAFIAARHPILSTHRGALA